MTESIKKIIQKVKVAANRYDDYNYTIDGDETAQHWLQYVKVEDNKIRIFPDFYGAWVVYDDTNYLVLVNHTFKLIPEFLEQLEEEINPGAWVAIVNELDLPVKRDIDSELEEILDFDDWELGKNDCRKINFSQVVGRYSLKECFFDVSLFKIVSAFTKKDDLSRIIGSILAKGDNYCLLPYSDNIIKKFEEIFENGNKYIPFDNLLASYVASDFKFAYLDLYRCIERLLPLYFFKEFYDTLSLKDEKSLLDFCKDFYQTTKLEPSVGKSLNLLLGSIEVKQIDDFALDKVRNEIVHLRPNQTNDSIPKNIEKWNDLIFNVLSIVEELYLKNEALF
jgi:hypothetical protein